MSSNQNSMATVRVEPKPMSKRLQVFIIVVVLLIGFVLGTRSQQLYNAVAPIFGLKADAGALDLGSVQAVYRELQTNYDGKLDIQALISGASKGLVEAAGDKYTVYLDAKEAEAFNKDLSGKIGGGIGVELGIRHDQPTVIRVLDGNPAKEAGVLAGDVVVAVNDQPTVGADTSKVAEQIRGDVGTSVKLKLLRGSESKIISITRAEVSNPSVEAKVENGIGILTVTRFDEETAKRARAAASEFVNQGVTSVILDLRGNGGGYLTAAQEVAGLWLKDKVIVSERTNGKVTDELKSSGDPLLGGIKTVILVDGGSASASEIVTGALKDYKVATIVGEKTFGKGTVQKVIDLGAGTKLKVTVARWYTPKGKNITKQGISPDTRVELTADDANNGRDPQLDKAKELLQ